MLALVAAAHAAPAPPSLPATTLTLDNGLVVLLLEDHRTDTVAIQISYGVGSLDERPGELGCAHLFEHLMFEASGHVPNGAFDEWLGAAGGDNNAFTSEDETSYVATFPSGALDLVLFLESDRLGFLDAGLTQENLDNQRAVVLRERTESYAEPHGRDQDALSGLVWPADHPYHHPVIGTVADVSGFDLPGVRAFWERHYRPRNAVLALVGNFDAALAAERVRYWFSDVPDRGPAVPRPVAPADAGPPRAGLVVDPVDERTVYLVWETVPQGHADEPALELLSRVLADGEGTRLDDRLYRRRPVATDLGAWSWSGRLAGWFQVYVSTTDEPLVVVKEIVRDEIARVARRAPRPGELERARASWRRDVLDLVEAPEGRAEALADCYVKTGAADCLAAEWARYDAVTPADLQRVARGWLSRPPAALSNVAAPGDAVPGATAVEIP